MVERAKRHFACLKPFMCCRFRSCWPCIRRRAGDSGSSRDAFFHYDTVRAARNRGIRARWFTALVVAPAMRRLSVMAADRNSVQIHTSRGYG
jgi:hypothetical protein